MGRVFYGTLLSLNKLRLTARTILPRYFSLPSTISFVLAQPVLSGVQLRYCAAAYPLSCPVMAQEEAN